MFMSRTNCVTSLSFIHSVILFRYCCIVVAPGLHLTLSARLPYLCEQNNINSKRAAISYSDNCARLQIEVGINIYTVGSAPNPYPFWWDVFRTSDPQNIFIVTKEWNKDGFQKAFSSSYPDFHHRDSISTTNNSNRNDENCNWWRKHIVKK